MFGIGTIGGMFLWGLLLIVFILCFSYIVWVSARREHGIIRLSGQILAISLIFLAVVVIFYSSMFGRLFLRSWKGNMGGAYQIIVPETGRLK
ncbi:MAG: hypothetical protein KKC80_00700 [Candidatus Margulisbacteria bacterium]|nr:hypothetical protein [Candidatus Margulisiibacteriota bacterium]MBU1616634.1 hypothetical protein [Candidatus Margulisiibacteriota bacterium]MBU1866975.1 hypothetical protein [Candidatus Margulisiibacteriota bacterium]